MVHWWKNSDWRRKVLSIRSGHGCPWEESTQSGQVIAVSVMGFCWRLARALELVISEGVLRTGVKPTTAKTGCIPSITLGNAHSTYYQST